MEYVDRIDGLLESLLNRESLDDSEKKCVHCSKGVWAVWRCRDCSLGSPMCRRCMRTSHKPNPFHRIERWTGNFFRSAHLWEVGGYLLVQHHTGARLCETLIRQLDFLETVEDGRDKAEQQLLGGNERAPAPAPAQGPAPATVHSTVQNDQPASSSSSSSAPWTWASSSAPWESESSSAPWEPASSSALAADNAATSDPSVLGNDQSEEEFMRYIQNLHECGPENNDTADIFELEDEVEEEEKDDPIANHYLPDEVPGPATGADYEAPTPFIGTYLRVVHSNGIHNIAMINCECRGHDLVAGDMLGAGLMPASFHRIRTLFTIQLLDLYRLSNLELKSSAYQFYHLLRRITAPMDPAGVVDLYREFRRMSRIWRWMKRLKWAGYPCNNKPVNEVKAGELAVFCAACPQPGINIPDNWKDDKARHVIPVKHIK